MSKFLIQFINIFNLGILGSKVILMVPFNQKLSYLLSKFLLYNLINNFQNKLFNNKDILLIHLYYYNNRSIIQKIEYLNNNKLYQKSYLNQYHYLIITNSQGYDIIPNNIKRFKNIKREELIAGIKLNTFSKHIRRQHITVKKYRRNHIQKI